MSRYFVLVKFNETDEIEIVTTSWLRNNNTQCMWPNYKNPSRIVTAIHDVKVLGGGHQFGNSKASVLDIIFGVTFNAHS